MSTSPQLLPTGSIIEILMDGIVMRGVVGVYEHYRLGQATFPARFGIVHHTVTFDSCTLLDLAPYSEGPRCLLATCEQHSADLDAPSANVLPHPRRATQYGHAASLAANTAIAG